MNAPSENQLIALKQLAVSYNARNSLDAMTKWVMDLHGLEDESDYIRVLHGHRFAMEYALDLLEHILRNAAGVERGEG